MEIRRQQVVDSLDYRASSHVMSVMCLTEDYDSGTSSSTNSSINLSIACHRLFVSDSMLAGVALSSSVPLLRAPVSDQRHPMQKARDSLQKREPRIRQVSVYGILPNVAGKKYRVLLNTGDLWSVPRSSMHFSLFHLASHLGTLRALSKVGIDPGDETFIRLATNHLRQ